MPDLKFEIIFLLHKFVVFSVPYKCCGNSSYDKKRDKTNVFLSNKYTLHQPPIINILYQQRR